MRYDVVIVGAGPAGLTAGLFAVRAGLKVVCLEQLSVGGQASLTADIQNYPGFISIAGFDLCDSIADHAETYGLEIKYAKVESVSKGKVRFEIKTRDETFEADKVIIACGCETRKLGLDKEKFLTGRGVSYCASCDGNFFRGQTVAVVGGGNSAIENVKYLSNVAKKVYLIHRSNNFKANRVDLEKVKKLRNVQIITNAEVKELFGDSKLEGVKLEIDGKYKDIKISGLFIAIGQTPKLDFLKIGLKKDKAGYIVTDKNMKTSFENLYACGDIISKDFRQVITACAEGAIAGNSCVGGL